MVRRVIEMRGIKKVYVTGSEVVEVLKGIDLVVEQGDFLAIMGPSG